MKRGILFITLFIILSLSVSGTIRESIESEALTYFTLDETTGTTVTDSTGLCNASAVSHNDAYWVNGKVGNAYNVSSGNQYIDTPCDATGVLDFDNSGDQTDSFTITAWYQHRGNSTGAGVTGAIWGLNWGGGEGHDFLYRQDATAIRYRFKECASTQHSLDFGSPVIDQWYHLLATYDDTNDIVIFYVDNVQVSNASTAVEGDPCNQGSNPDYNIGVGEWQSGSYDGYANGVIDMPAIFDRVLNDTERSFLYNSGDGFQLFTDVNTAPSAVDNDAWITPATNPDKTNETTILFNWTASVDSEGDVLNYSLFVNETLVYSGNQSHYTHTLAGQNTYGYWVNVTDGEFFVNGSKRVLIIDLTAPTAVRVFPNPNNSTFYTDATNVVINSSYADNTEVFAYNISIWTAEYRASSLVVERGTQTAGNLTSVYLNDNDVLTITEPTGAPSTRVNINFSNVTTATTVHMVAQYEGSAGHVINFQFYNNTLNDWSTLTRVVSNDSFINKEFEIPQAQLVSSGVVQTRFDHAGSGNPTHQLIINKISVHSPTGINKVVHTSAENLNVTVINVSAVFDLSGQDAGEYIVRDEVVDSHTIARIARVNVTTNDVLRRAYFQREHDGVGVQHVTSTLLDESLGVVRDVTSSFTRWEYEQLTDRVRFSHTGTERGEGLYRHVYDVTSTHALYMKPSSSYAGHIVSGLFSWVDFEHDGLVSASMVRRGSAVRVTVISTTANPDYNSIGGLNKIFLYTGFSIEESPPFINNLESENGLNYSPTKNYLFNATVTDLAGVSRVTLELNESNYTMSVLVGDVYQIGVGVLGAGVRQWKVHANDSAGVAGVSSVFNHTILQAKGVISLVQNATIPVLNGTTLSINCTSANAEQNVSMYVNGTINASTFFVVGDITQSYFVNCTAPATGNYTLANASRLVYVYYPNVVEGILLPNQCPNGSTTSVLMFGLLFLIVITFFIINQMIIKLPIMDVGAGLAMIFLSLPLIGCNFAIAGVAIMFGVSMAVYGFLD